MQTILSKTALFQGCPMDQLADMLDSLNHTYSSYDKNQIIFHAGTPIQSIGVVLRGSIQIERLDLLGNKSILGIAEEGDIFAESYACIPNQPLLVDVVARENSEILFIHVPSLFEKETKSPYHFLLLQNLIRLTAKKNLGLSQRIFHSAPKTIRERLYSYFSEQTALQNSMHIRIPLDRQQLADYLGVDRSALSKELSKMKQEGLLDYHKNEFLLYQEPEA